MNRKCLFFVIALCVFAITAEAAPKLLKVYAGNLRVNFDPARECSPIDVYWNERPMITGIFGPYLSYSEPAPGFVGAGRKFKEFKETLESFTVKIDGKPVDWKTAPKLAGESAECERVTQMRDFKVVYVIRLEGDKMTEEVTFTPSAEVTLMNMYHAHPWNKRFAEYVTVNQKDVKTAGKVTHAKKIVFNGHSVAMAFCDPAGEEAAVIRGERSDKAVPTRFVQDNWNAPTECLLVSGTRTIPANTALSYKNEITFLKAGSAEATLNK